MIFISYRISDSLPMVRALDADLTKEFGAEAVFRDKSRLQGGQNWTKELESNAKTRRVMLVVIGATWQTAEHKDGDLKGFPRLFDAEDWVRKEITYALDAGNIVIPVFLDGAELPAKGWLNTCGLQRLHHMHGERLRNTDYDNDLAHLVAVMRKQCPELPSHQDPNSHPPTSLASSTAELDKVVDAARKEQEFHLASFVGREQTLAELREWIAGQSDGRYLLLTGPPGQGKSALMAKLAEQESKQGGCLLHMMKLQSQPRRFVPALISQAAKLASFEPKFYQGDLDDLRLALFDALATVKEKCGRAVVVLDALDEMDGEGKDGSFLPPLLPDGVRFVMTCRPDEPLILALQSRLGAHLEVRSLEPFTLHESTLLLHSRLDSNALEVLGQQVDVKQLLEHLEGNPLFLRCVLEDLAERCAQAVATRKSLRLDLADLPSKMKAVFRTVYDRIRGYHEGKPASRIGNQRARLMKFLCLAWEPLGFEELTELMNDNGHAFSLGNCHDRLAEMSQWLLDVGHGRFKPFHKNLAEHVQNHVLGKDGQHKIHESFCRWLEKPAAGLSSYGLRHRIRHLLALGRADGAADLLTDLRFLEAKAEEGLVFDLAKDFRETLHALPLTHGLSPVLQLLEEGLRHNIHFIDRHPTTLFQCLWNSCWWYDCPQARDHYEESTAPGPEPWEQPRLSSILESWREAKQRQSPPLAWVRSLRPSASHLGTGQDIIFRKHGGNVNALAFSPDATLVASGGHRTVRLWNLASGFELFCFRKHESVVHSVAFSPDGRRLVSGSDDATICIWDLAKPSEVRRLRGHGGPVTGVAFTPDGRKFVSGSLDKTVRVWNVDTGTELGCLRHPDEVTSVAVSPDGQRLLSGCQDKIARIWKLSQAPEKVEASWQVGARILAPRDDHFWYPGTIAALQGERFLVHFDAARPAEVATNQLVAMDLDVGSKVDCNWKGRSGFFPATIIQKNGAEVTVCYDGGAGIEEATSIDRLRVWRAQAANVECRGHDGPVLSVAFSPHGGMIATGSSDGTIRTWSVAQGAEIRCLRGHLQPVGSVAFSADGGKIVSGSFDATIRVWLTDTGDQVLCLRGHEDNVQCALLTPDERWLVSASGDRTARVWNMAHVSEFRRLRGHDATLTCLAFSPDGKRVVSGSEDETVRVWSTDDGTELFQLRGHQGDVAAVSFSADGKQILTGAWDRTIRIWDAAHGKELLCLEGHRHAVSSLSCSADGQRFASGSYDGTVRVWQPVSADSTQQQFAFESRCLEGHWHWVHCVAFSPDGKQIASGSEDRTVRLWDAATGAELHCLEGPEKGVRQLAYSIDGRHIVGHAHAYHTNYGWWVWEVATGKLLHTLVTQGDFAAFAQKRPTGGITADMETLFVSRAASKVMDRFPGLKLLRCHPHDRLWAGANGNQLYLLRLEGPPKKMAPPRPFFSWRKGSKVLARWSDLYWYPGTIQTVEDERVSVLFDFDTSICPLLEEDGIPVFPSAYPEGDAPWRGRHEIRPLDFETDSRVECFWLGNYHFYPATIAAKDGDRFVIHYDDGDEDWVSLGQLRVWRDDSQSE